MWIRGQIIRKNDVIFLTIWPLYLKFLNINKIEITQIELCQF